MRTNHSATALEVMRQQADHVPIQDEADERPSPLSSQLLSITDLGRLPAAEPLVDGLLYRNTLAQLAGPPGSYKSFVAVGLACAVAAGETWETHQVPKRERVVYVAAEGASGLRARILAWCELTNVDPTDLDGWLHVLPTPIQLGITSQVDLAADMVTDVGAGLLVVDTRARCTLGLEENSATEQGRAIASAERIREVAGCTVFVIHHTGRTGTAPRGSTAWDGAVWSDLRLKSDYLTASIHVEKHKDAPSGMDFHYRLARHTVSEFRMPGVGVESRKSLVVFPHDGGKSVADEAGSTRTVWEICGKTCGDEGLTRSQIVELSESAGVSKTRAYLAVKVLVERRILRNIGTEKRARYVCDQPTVAGAAP